jgi:hypothetical protein
MAPTDTNGPAACADKIEALLQRYPVNPWTENKAKWDACRKDLQVLILTEGGAFKDDWQGAQIRLWGYKATSTTGLEGAARNWIAQVRAKLGASA